MTEKTKDKCIDSDKPGVKMLKKYQLVSADIHTLIDTCSGDIDRFNAFGKRESQASETVNVTNGKLEILRETWFDIQSRLMKTGLDEEGDYSYAVIGYKLSLAYKQRSEILNAFRFGLERNNLSEKYDTFEMYYG